MNNSNRLLMAAALIALPQMPLIAAPPAGNAAKGIAQKPPAIDVLTPLRLPDGIAGTDAGLAYLMNATGGIDACELATGKVRWTTKAASKPLLAFKQRLVAQIGVEGQANALRIIGLDAASGKVLLTSELLTFPDWVNVAAENGTVYGRTFSSSSALEGDELVFSWQASSHYAGGAAPPPEIEEAERRQAGGTFLVDLKTGKVKITEMPMTAEENAGDDAIVDTSRPVSGSLAAQGKAVIGDIMMSLAVKVDGDKDQTLVIERQDLKTKKALPDMELFTGKPQLLAGISLDGAHALAMAEVGYAPEAPSVSVFSLATGQQVARFAFDNVSEISEISVIGPRAFWVRNKAEGGRGRMEATERTLIAVDLKTGKELWTHPLTPRQPLFLPM